MIEKQLQLTDFIVTKTNLKGIITHSNQVFADMVEYTIPELIGKNHNIIRHPDMPKGVFYYLWQNIVKEKEIFAFVKNKTKHNNYYWVWANVTPNYNQNNELVGYTSIRRKPNKKAIDLIEKVYLEMKDIEHEGTIQDSINYLVDVVKNSGCSSYQELVLKLQKQG